MRWSARLSMCRSRPARITATFSPGYGKKSGHCASMAYLRKACTGDKGRRWLMMRSKILVVVLQRRDCPPSTQVPATPRAHLAREQVWRCPHVLLQRGSVQEHVAHVAAAGDSPACDGRTANAMGRMLHRQGSTRPTPVHEKTCTPHARSGRALAACPTCSMAAATRPATPLRGAPRRPAAARQTAARDPCLPGCRSVLPRKWPGAAAAPLGPARVARIWGALYIGRADITGAEYERTPHSSLHQARDDRGHAGLP